MVKVDPVQFVQTVGPLLKRNDLQALCATLRANWTERQIVRLLRGDHADARKVAALSLGLLGESHCIDALVDQLGDPDPMVNQMAEHALWSIWFRSGKPCAHRELIRGTRESNARQYEQAIAHFTRAIELDPDFAEAYNQRAIVYYLLEDYESSARDCQAAIDRMPCHFGAWAGLGHCHAHLDRLDDALECYERAIEINPYLSSLCDTVAELKLASN